MKKALVTGITGQDGSYLSELLLAKGYESMASSAARAPSTPAALTISIMTRTKPKKATACFCIMVTFRRQVHCST